MSLDNAFWVRRVYLFSTKANKFSERSGAGGSRTLVFGNVDDVFYMFSHLAIS